MSQAGRTRYFARSATRARSARRGEEKNKAITEMERARASLLGLTKENSTLWSVGISSLTYWALIGEFEICLFSRWTSEREN